MDKIIINSDNVVGVIKPMNAVNNGPVRENCEYYKELEIPYARTHDASFKADYGGERTVDITAVFPDFTKNPYDEASYDFCVTDKYLKEIEAVGTNVFYRLGQKIDHRIKKYDNKVPEDFQKWAVICEHIIRYYNYGWANGFHMNIEYWEIWNEPNLGWAGYADDSELGDWLKDKQNWTDASKDKIDGEIMNLHMSVDAGNAGYTGVQLSRGQMLKFKVKMDLTNFQMFGLNAEEATGYAWARNGYSVVVKRDAFEVQKKIC